MARALTARRRDELTRAAIVILAGYSSSRWEFEAAVRHGIRSALCLKGIPWQTADSEAAEIVAVGLWKIGARNRPSWSEGQPDTLAEDLVERRYCQKCGKRIPDERRHSRGGRQTRFCSFECKDADWHQRAHASGERLDRARWEAEMAARREDRKRPCAHCGTIFTPRSPEREHCSPACAGAARRGEKRLAARECPQCHATFIPKTGRAKYCSTECANDAKRREDGRDRVCGHCSARFRVSKPADPKRFCSRTCAQRARRLGEAGRAVMAEAAE